MLENKSSHEKKKSQLLFNVGGSGCVIGGVVLLGGGLAVAGLVAAFTIIKKINSARYDQKNEDAAAADTLPEKIHDVTQGLGSVLQNPTTAVHQKSCYTNHSTPTVAVIESHMDSRELISARNMDSGDKSVAIMDGEKEDPQQEILFSDDFNKESIEPCNEILNNEETSLQAPDIIIKNHSLENLQLIQNTETKKEDELAETQNLAIEDALPTQSEAEEEEEDYGGSEEHVMDKEEVSPEGEIAPKANSTMQPVEKEEKESEEDENLPMQPVEEEEGDDEDDHDEKHRNDDSSEEDVTEKEEESSEEGTGSSSRESNVEAIWPTDMIEALSHELMNASNQNSVEKMAKIECDYLNSRSENGSKNENAQTLNKKTPQEFVMSKVESIHLPMREVCVWLLLAIILLLLLLHIHRTSPLHDLSYENSVIGPRV